jgi:hypothetical protein
MKHKTITLMNVNKMQTKTKNTIKNGKLK